MLKFEHPEILLVLLVIPVMVLIFLLVLRWKKKALAAFGDKKVFSKMIPAVSFSKPWLKFMILVLAFTALVIGMANPQIGTKLEEVQRKGSDLMILLDISNSMLSKDLPPNRLENAKRAISQMIDNLHSDRIGIVVFAGEAYVQLPVTTDYSAAKLFLNTINPDIIPEQGTAIGAAIDLGMKSFDFTNESGKTMILMTDGENHEDDAVAAAKAAQDKKVVIHVIGFGSPQGTPIPIYQQGKEIGFHTDKAGQTVLSKLNEDMCKEISAAGGGIYIRASSQNSGMGIVMDQVGKMEQKNYGSKLFREFEDRFQFFLAICVILLVLEFFISSRKTSRLSRLNLFDVEKQ